MKICHFLPWYSPARIGGTEIYILELSKRLVEQENEVLIICPSSTTAAESFTVRDIPVIASPTILEEPSSYRVKLGIEPPSFLKEFSSFLADIKPDILHFHCFWPLHIFYLEAANKMGIKTLITPHLAGFTCLRDDLMRENKIPCDGKVLIDRCSYCLLHNRSKEIVVIQKSAYAVSKLLFKAGINTGYSNKVSRLFSIPFFVKNKLSILKRINTAVNAVVAISPWYKKDLLENDFAAEKVKLILTTPYLPVTNGINTPGNVLKVVFIGRQNREKGLHILLQALTFLPADKIELHLYGKVQEGLFEEDIHHLTKRGYKIHQHGETAHPVMIEELKKMDVLCLPTPGKEMAPLVIREAFACGVPAIGSDLGGIVDAITDGSNGFLFAHNNPQNLSEKINTLIKNPELLKQMKYTAVNSVVKNDVASKYIELYRELLGSSNTNPENKTSLNVGYN
jgi:glycosyltransferase involved in cell wall biosynthesis